MRRIVVAGALASRPGNSGGAWVRLHWVRGLVRLGFEVLFLEQWRGAADAATPEPPRRAIEWFDRVTDRFGEGGSGILIGREDGIARIESEDGVDKFIRSSELLVNLGGHLRDPELLGRFRKRAYVDLDPGFTQIWHAQGTDLALDAHDSHFTVGVGIGRPGCRVPTGGLEWQPILPPVVLSAAAYEGDGGARTFTTVGAWRGPFGPLEWEGKTLGIKVHEFRKFVELPTRTGGVFRPALRFFNEDQTDRDALLGHGWDVVDPELEVPTIDGYRRFIARSGAEFSAAQGVYVGTRSGWFSDRSAQYLASGKPVLLQDTGFGDSLPVGLGLLSFSDLAEAEGGVDRILSDYSAHHRTARDIAREYFDSDRVLPRFLERNGVEPPKASALAALRPTSSPHRSRPAREFV